MCEAKDELAELFVFNVFSDRCICLSMRISKGAWWSWVESVRNICDKGLNRVGSIRVECGP